MTRYIEEIALKHGIAYVLAVVLISLGITLQLTSGLGASSFDAMQANIATYFDMKLGYITIIVGFILILFSLLVRKKLLIILTAITSIFVGMLINFWLYRIFTDVYPLNVRVWMFIIGVLVLPLGVALILYSKLPPSPIDSLALSIMHIIKTDDIVLSKSLGEVFALILALLFGLLAGIGFGYIGLGTIISAALIGPLIGIYNKYLIYRGWLNELQ